MQIPSINQRKSPSALHANSKTKENLTQPSAILEKSIHDCYATTLQYPVCNIS